MRAFLLRHRADSNRCTRFCRPLPSHSATMPIYCSGWQIYIYFAVTQEKSNLNLFFKQIDKFCLKAYKLHEVMP